MTAHAFSRSISRDTEVAGTLGIVAPAALYAVEFSTPRSKNPEPELLPPAAGDCAAGSGLTKSEDEETIIINRPDRSTYPDEKSVLTSGATPYDVSAVTAAARLSRL
jgi:hypothetical protein